ncbi:MAG: hypothetical protein MZW92_16970 [Comamonadaceae bacterium]|nr:hypothetical protein [Comamonadaceae bacterium]
MQRHLNIIAVAQLKKVAAILMPKGDAPEADRAGAGRQGGHLHAPGGCRSPSSSAAAFTSCCTLPPDRGSETHKTPKCHR